MVHISVSSLGGVHRIGGRICSYLEASVGEEEVYVEGRMYRLVRSRHMVGAD